MGTLTPLLFYFGQLLAHSKDLFILGNANECEYESESVRKLLGYSMLGPVQWLTVHPDDREMHGAAHVASFTETMATGQPVWTCQDAAAHARRSLDMVVQNRFCHSGARWLAVLRDLSEHKRIETSLRDFRKLLTVLIISAITGRKEDSSRSHCD